MANIAEVLIASAAIFTGPNALLVEDVDASTVTAGDGCTVIDHPGSEVGQLWDIFQALPARHSCKALAMSARTRRV